MEITIKLPEYESVERGTYKGVYNYLKELELCIHHAQKSVESAEKNGIKISEDTYINFNHPALTYLASKKASDEVKRELDNFSDNYYSELQCIELHIALQ